MDPSVRALGKVTRLIVAKQATDFQRAQPPTKTSPIVATQSHRQFAPMHPKRAESSVTIGALQTAFIGTAVGTQWSKLQSALLCDFQI